MPPKPTPPPPTGSNRRRNMLIAGGVAVALVIALIVASLVLTGGDDDSATTTDTTTGSLEGIPQADDVLGDEGADVTLIQFEDLQCPICREYMATGFPGIVDEYVRPGKVKVRFVGISFIGPDSETALRAVLAAGKQGKLFQMAEALYAKQGDENSGWVTEELLEETATEIGIDPAKMKTDAASAAVTAQVQKMEAEREQRQVPGTPWFFVQIGDDEPYEVRPPALDTSAFRPILDDALQS